VLKAVVESDPTLRLPTPPALVVATPGVCNDSLGLLGEEASGDMGDCCFVDEFIVVGVRS
jgi:hypothetical protein